MARLSERKIDQKSPYLYHKTTMRELYNKEAKLAKEAGFSEVIFRNSKQEITEGSISNLVIRKNDRFFTPPVSCGLLPGTMRGWLLKDYPNLISEKILYQEDLESADAVYLINSLRGLVPYKIVI